MTGRVLLIRFIESECDGENSHDDEKEDGPGTVFLNS